MARIVQDDLLDDKVILNGYGKESRIQPSDITRMGVNNAETVTRKVDTKDSDETQNEPTKKQFTLEDLFKQTNSDPIPTPEDTEKEERRAKNRQLIAMIGDGLSSIANIVGVNNGAMALNTGSLSKENSDRYKEFLEKRRLVEDKYKDGLYRARTMDMSLNAQTEARRQAQEITNRNFIVENERWDKKFTSEQNQAKIKNKNDTDNLALAAIKVKNDKDYKDKDLKIKVANNLRDNAARGKSTSSNSISSIAYRKGNEVVALEYPKSKENAILGMYPDVVAEINASGDKNAISNMKTIMGMYGDSKSKMLAVINANVAKYPTLNGKLFKILGLEHQEDGPIKEDSENLQSIADRYE